MTVYELNREQMVELKQDYLAGKLLEVGQEISYGELSLIDSLVSDKEIFDCYECCVFSNEDFFCTAGKE